MSSWFNFLFLILFFCLLGTNSSYAIDHGPMIFGYEMAPISPGRFHLSPNIQFFQSKANYDTSGGSYEDLPNGGSYQNISGNLNTAYDMNSYWRVLAGLRFANANSDDGSFQRSNGELNELTFGLLISPYYRINTKIYIELIGTLALNSIEKDTDQVITGEAAHNVLGGAKISQMLSLIELFATLHLQYYTDGRSTRLPWRTGAYLHLSSFKIIGSIFGFQSVIDDEHTDRPTERTTITNRVNGGSYRYNSVNPSVIDTQLGIAYQPYPDLQFELGATKTINGESFSEGLGAYFAVVLYWGGDDGDTRESRRIRRKLLRKSPTQRERFETKQEDYDEELFEERQQRAKRKKRRRQAIDIDEAIDDAIRGFE